MITSIESSNVANTTSIKTTFDGLSEEEKKAREILREHYNEVYYDNLSHSNPIAWIESKYCDVTSPYFRKEMSSEQRNIAYRNEKRMIETGGVSTAGFGRFDYALRNYPDLYTGNSSQNSYSRNIDKEKFRERCSINEQIFQLLNSNGISISNTDEIRLRIDPYYFQVSITGNISQEKKTLMEQLLNSGGNAKELWTHIWNCMHDSNNNIVNVQGSISKQQQFALWHEFNSITGYDIRKVQAKDGLYFMPDGTKLLSTYKDKANPSGYELFSDRLKQFVLNGWNYTNDLYLEIGLNSNGLYDIGQSNGFGITQSEWITDNALFDVKI